MKKVLFLASFLPSLCWAGFKTDSAVFSNGVSTMNVTFTKLPINGGYGPQVSDPRWLGVCNDDGGTFATFTIRASTYNNTDYHHIYSPEIQMDPAGDGSGTFYFSTQVGGGVALQMDQNYIYSYLPLQTPSIIFPDSSEQTTAWIDAPFDGTTYGRNNGAWAATGGGGGGGYALEPATVTIQANKGISASTAVFTSSVSVGGVFSSSGTKLNICNASASQTISLNCDVYVASVTTAGITLTFPDATLNPGEFHRFYKTDFSTGAINFGTTSSQTIDDSTQTIRILYPHESRKYFSDGLNWRSF